MVQSPEDQLRRYQLIYKHLFTIRGKGDLYTVKLLRPQLGVKLPAFPVSFY